MKNVIIILLSIFSMQNLFTQEIKQNILVEHYTNTRCGTCSQKNPILFSLLENYNEVHLAYYPSSPYSACIFSMHNATEADGRTNYYNIFGSTPRVVLNGEVIPATTVILQESKMDSEVPKKTPFKIDIKQEYIHADSVKVTVKISTVSGTNFTNLNLHVMLAEKLIKYDAPNGEEEHPNVFRKALYGLNGKSFSVPSNGSDITFSTNYGFDPDWKIEDLKIIAFIQNNIDKSIKQAQNSTRLGGLTNINSLKDSDIEIFPNPTKDILTFKGLKENTNISLFNILGKKVLNSSLENNTLNMGKLPQGIYFLEFFIDEKRFVQKINKI